MSDVFELSWDFERVPQRLARLVEFPGEGNVVAWIHTRPLEVPTPVYFVADLAAVDATCADYPTNNRRWPIMSQRMLDVLLSVASFRHRALPVVLLDEDDTGEEPSYQGSFQPRPGACRDGYVAVQLLEHTEAIDWDRTKCEANQEDPDDLWRLHKLALKAPAPGFPPLFRLAGAGATLWVSAQGHQALRAAQVRGPGFEPFGSASATPVYVDPPPEVRRRGSGHGRHGG